MPHLLAAPVHGLTGTPVGDMGYIEPGDDSRALAGATPNTHARTKPLSLWLGRAVGAAGGIEALVGKYESFDGFSVHDVGFDDFLHVGSRDPSVPDAIGIDHDRGSVLALVETSRHVGAHSFLEPPQSEFLLEQELQFGLARRIAASARMSSFALIATDEEMLFELGHDIKCTGFLWQEALGRSFPPADWREPESALGPELIRTCCVAIRCRVPWRALTGSGSRDRPWITPSIPGPRLL